MVFLDPNLELEGKICEEKMAIILSCDKDNFERFLMIAMFDDLLRELNLRSDLYSIIRAQFVCLKAIKANLMDENALLNALLKLSLTFDLKELLSWVKNQGLNIDKKSQFNSSNLKLNAINQSLQSLASSQYKASLQEAANKFANLSFSVAITGIMNAGKSSMLNALLKSDFLAVSNIPETANLTVIKYGKEKAIIHFWTKSEFDIIKNKPSFKINLDEYIQENGVIKEIKLGDLKFYSSAKNEISFLIKKIELYTKLEFCKDGVSIVDTPGLDDVIYQRELISKKFIQEADFLIHLMNASQPMSKKDLDFLIYCLSSSRLSKFLIVLTKSDLLSKEELDEAQKYCLKRLKSRLDELFLDKALINKLDFLCVSSKLANDYYANKASKDELLESNMPRLERYLFNELFSNAKSKLVLKSYKNELKLIANALLKENVNEANLLKNSLNKLDTNNQEIFLKLSDLKSSLNEAKAALAKINLSNEDEFIKNAQTLLAKRLNDRLVNELKYSESKKISLDLNRLDTVISIGFKDGINDILRDILYRVFAKMQGIKEKLELRFSFLKGGFDSGFDEFKQNIQAASNSLLSKDSFKQSKDNLKAFLSSSKSYEAQSLLEDKIQAILATFKLESFIQDLRLNELFKEYLSKKLASFEAKQNAEEANLKQILEKLGGNQEASLYRQKQLNENKKSLEIALKELNHAN